MTPGLSGGRELTAARNRKISAHLKSPSEATFTIDGRHEEALEIEELVTDLVVRRDGSIIYRGRVGPTRDTINADGHQMSVTTGDLRAVLGRRLLYDDDQLSWLATDKATIVWNLIQQTQGNTAGDLGITNGTTPLGEVVSHEFAAGTYVGVAIDNLSAEGAGFDWDIDPATRAVKVWAERGENRRVVLDLDGLVAEIERVVDPTTYANANRNNGVDGLLDIETRQAADLATRPEGRWDAQHGHPDVMDALTLVERADWQIAQDQVLQPAYTVTLRPGAWGGPDHIWLGDMCRLPIRSGRLNVNTLLRVHDIDIDLGDAGAIDSETPSVAGSHEIVKLTVGQPAKRELARDVAAQEQRLAQLERR